MSASLYVHPICLIFLAQNRQGCTRRKWFRCRREHVREESAATFRGVYAIPVHDLDCQSSLLVVSTRSCKRYAHSCHRTSHSNNALCTSFFPILRIQYPRGNRGWRWVYFHGHITCRVNLSPLNSHLSSFQSNVLIHSSPGTGAVYSFDPVGSYEREACRAAGAAQSLVQPFLDNQVSSGHSIISTIEPPVAPPHCPSLISPFTTYFGPRVPFLFTFFWLIFADLLQKSDPRSWGILL